MAGPEYVSSRSHLPDRHFSMPWGRSGMPGSRGSGSPRAFRTEEAKGSEEGRWTSTSPLRQNPSAMAFCLIDICWTPTWHQALCKRKAPRGVAGPWRDAQLGKCIYQSGRCVCRWGNRAVIPFQSITQKEGGALAREDSDGTKRSNVRPVTPPD